MKHSLSAWLVLAATFCLFSCTRETVEVRDRHTYESTIVLDLAETRTTNNGDATAWSDKDAITAIHTDTQGAEHNTRFYSSEFVYTGASNAFRGPVADAADVNDWYLVYPYREDNTDARQIHITVENSPVQEGNDNMAHLAGSGFPLVGKKLGVEGKDIRMSMHQALAVLKLKVDNALETPIIVKKIAVAFPESMKESGNFVGDLTADKEQWTPEDGSYSQLTLTVNNGTEITDESAHFYVGVLPGTVKGGQPVKIQITAVDTSTGAEFVYYKSSESTSDRVMGANSIITIKNINVDKDHSTDPNPSGPTVLKDRAFSFTNATVEWTIGVDCELNTLRSLPQSVNGAKTDDAYYTSSNESVAQIVKDGSTYKIKVLKDGETTIWAKADATSEYEADQASYKLTVYEAAVVTPTTVTYRYASSISAGTYLIAGTESTGNQLSVALFPTVNIGTWTSNGENKQISNGQYLAEKVIGTYSNQNWPSTIEANTTTDAEMIASEVDLVAGSSNNTWKVKINANAKYLQAPSESYRIVYADNESSATNFTVSSSSINNGNYYFFHSRGAGGFTIRNTQQTMNLRFYKRESASTSQQSQTISFGLTEYPFVLGDTYKLETAIDLPKVSGNKSKVTYTISNQDKAVAEVTEDGEHFIIHKTGTVTLSAQAVATTSYAASNVATTKLVITNSSSSSDKKDQTVTFSQQQKTITWTLGQGYEKGQSYPAEVPGGSYQSSLLEYTSGNDQIVAVNGKQLRIVGTGTVTITAKAKSNDEYNESNADTYTLSVVGSGAVSGDRTYEYASSIQAGETYIITGIESDGGNFSVALFPTVESHTWTSTSTSETISNGQRVPQKVLGTYSSSNWPSTVTASATGDADIIAAEVTFVSAGNNAWKIKLKNGQYLSVSENYRIPLVDSESSATSFSVGNNSITYTSGGSGSSWGGNWGGSTGGTTYYFFHSKGAEGFTFRSGTSTTNLRFYRLTSGGGSTGPQDQTPSFPNKNVSWTLGQNGHTVGSNHTITSFNNPTGVQTTITGYTSSNTGVATIVNTNQVRIVGTGTTTITATVSSNAQWNSTTFSFNLTINSDSSTTPSTDATYVKATSLAVGETYLITSVDDTKLFKGASDGSYVSINASSGVITDPNNAYSGYEFTITQSGSKYCIIFNDGKYLLCDYSTSGNSTTGLVFESTKPSDSYLYSLTVTGERFEFMTAQRNSSSTSEVLYYKPESMGGTGPDKFKIGGSGVGIGVHLFLKTSSGTAKKTQSPYFSQGTISQSMATASGTMSVQSVQNAYGTVTYSSSNTSVATISGTTITIKGFGSTTITANAAGNDEYYAGSATYTLNINRLSQEGVYNLENSALMGFLDAAMSQYLTSSSSIVGNYAKNVGQNNRLDWPAPVSVTWSSVLTGNKVVYVYNDAAHTDQVNYIEPVSVGSSTNTADIYNLIPGRTYYYSVRSGNSEVASGSFTTEGRRRMMKVGSDYGQNFANNCRDLGGQETISGKKIKFGKIFRGTNMDGCNGTRVDSGFGKSSGALSDEAKTTILQYMNIKLDVDLRGSGNTLGSNMNNALGFDQIPAGTATTYVGHTQETYANTSDLTNTNKQYNGMTKMGVTLSRIMRAAINNTNVYIHCMVGADRTGFTCMMLEAVLGVRQEYCDIDYEITSFSGVGSRTRPSSGYSYTNHYSEGVNAINARSGNTYQDKAIDYIVNVHGVDRNLITQFQNAMLE